MESCECFSLVNQSKHPLLSFICPLWYKTTVINQSSRQQIFNKLSFWSTEGLKWRMVSARNNHIRETTGIYHLVLLCILFCFQCKLILCCLIKLNCVASISQNRCQSQQTSVVKWKLNKQINKISSLVLLLSRPLPCKHHGPLLFKISEHPRGTIFLANYKFILFSDYIALISLIERGGLQRSTWTPSS